MICSMSKAIRSSSLQATQSLAAGRERRNSVLPSWLTRNHQEVYITPRRRTLEVNALSNDEENNNEQQQESNADVVNVANDNMAEEQIGPVGYSVEDIAEVEPLGSPVQNIPAQRNNEYEEEDAEVSLHAVVAEDDKSSGQPTEHTCNVTCKKTCFLKDVYVRVVFWRKNMFQIPKGKQGRRYLELHTKYINGWCDNTSMRSFAWYAVMSLPHIMLQKTDRKMNNKLKKETLCRRLDAWEGDGIEECFRESSMLQARFSKKVATRRGDDNLEKQFSTLMANGKVGAAIKLLESSTKGGILQINDETRKLLKEKHPQAEPLHKELLLNGPVHSIPAAIYDSLSPDLIQNMALRTRGSSGPSGMDSDEWRRMLGTQCFKTSSDNLRVAISRFSKILCIEKISDLESIAPILACRLIPLDKCPGLRPIGVGEVLRRIIAKAVMWLTRNDLQTAAGGLQLCVGVPGGAEAGIHAMRSIFEDDNTEGILQIDASNAFNSINRRVLLHNINYICPEIAIFVNNCYGKPVRLFVTGGIEIESSEGTTQGDPIAMPVYAVGLLPLIACLISDADVDPVKHEAFADDLAGGGSIIRLKSWWTSVKTNGKFVGYYVEPTKSWLTVKEEFYAQAVELFADEDIKITVEGRKHLGAAIGSVNYKNQFVNEKVDIWINEIAVLAKIALTDPHAAYSCFTHGYQQKFNFVMRTVPDISNELYRLDEAIDKFVSNLFYGHTVSEFLRNMVSLPVKFGGLGISIPSKLTDAQYIASRRINASLIAGIVEQCQDSQLNLVQMRHERESVKKENYQKQIDTITELKNTFDDDMAVVYNAITETGASNWLTVIPI